MKQPRFTDSQISEDLKQVEAGLAILELRREMGISSVRLFTSGGLSTAVVSTAAC